MQLLILNGIFKSINISNHKYGLFYVGMGSLLFKNKEEDILKELFFDIKYLGGNMSNFSLNFSKPTFPIILQYYHFLRLGYQGYCDNCDLSAFLRNHENWLISAYPLPKKEENIHVIRNVVKYNLGKDKIKQLIKNI